MKLASLVIGIAFTLVIMGYKAVSKINPECHCYLFQSSGASNGTFKSPNFPHFYPFKIGCILYIFVAALDELVEITLHDFDIRFRNKDGICPDHFRLFLNLDRPELSERDPWDYQFCGPMTRLTQSVFYSRHRVIIAEFHTTGQLGNNYRFRGFKGNFNFLKRAQFKIDGTRIPGHCRYIFKASEFLSGRFFSPDYPQNYPNHTDCVYEFQAAKDERVIVDLSDIKLEHFKKKRKCPITLPSSKCDPISAGDKIVVYDGESNSDRVLGRFCGYVHARQVVSHGRKLSVRIQSDGNGIQGQGFSGRYQFVNKHTVQPSRVLDDTMRGDGQVPQQPPCVYEYHSTNARKSGLFELPKSPYEENAKCLFTFHGNPGERVTINFRTVKLDDADPNRCRSYSGDRIEVYDGMSDAQNWLAVFCGHVTQKIVVSTGRSLTVKFLSDGNQIPIERGFEASYSFTKEEELTDLKDGKTNGKLDINIPDKNSPKKECRYSIISKVNGRTGIFQTPGYPNGFKKGKICYWLFYGDLNERVRIKFSDFSLNKDQGYLSVPGELMPTTNCQARDRMEIYHFRYMEDQKRVVRQPAPIELCGALEPQPIMSDKQARLDVIFHSVGGSRSSARGVRFKYTFVKDFGVHAPESEQKPGECSFTFSGHRSTNGSFNSPNYPGDYPDNLRCDFYFKGMPRQKISISFADFDVYSDDSSPSCTNGPGDFIEALECPPIESQKGLTEYLGPKRFCRRPEKGQIYRIDWPLSCLHLRFQSNNLKASRGFFAYYSFSHESHMAKGSGTNGCELIFLWCSKGSLLVISLFRILSYLP